MYLPDFGSVGSLEIDWPSMVCGDEPSNTDWIVYAGLAPARFCCSAVART